MVGRRTFAGSAAWLEQPKPQWLHGQGMPAPVRFHGNGSRRQP